MTSKKALRQMIRLRKQEHSAAESSALLTALQSESHFANARTLLLYSALPDEVQINPLFDGLIAQGKTILLPRVVSDTDMELRLYTGADSLQPGAFGIMEPTGPLYTDYAAIDVAVIPGMAFDADGHRLGRGKGYYDRFLSKLSALHTKLYKIGLCFPWQLVDEVPSDAHDIMMDGVISQNAHQ